MIDHTELAYRQSMSIPAEIRKDLAEVIQRNASKVHWSEPDLRYVFDVWNRYMTREPEDITCPGCRAKVISKLKRIVVIWEAKGEL